MVNYSNFNKFSTNNDTKLKAERQLVLLLYEKSKKCLNNLYN